MGNSVSSHNGNREKDILIPGKEPTDGLDDTTVTAEAEYSVNITNSRNKICLNLHYNAANSFCMLIVYKTYLIKAKDSEIKLERFF